MSTIKQILSRCILDGDFLENLKSNPEAALADYEINDRHREILTSRDARVLELLGEVHQENANAIADSPVENRTTQSSSPADNESDCDSKVNASNTFYAIPLKQTELAVRLVPYASRVSEDPESAIQLTYATHVNPLPDSGSFDDLPTAPVQDGYGQPLPTLAVHISIQPYTAQAENGQMLSFDVQARIPPAEAETASLTKKSIQAEAPTSLINAVEAVRFASSNDRMARLCELIVEINAEDSVKENLA